MKKNLISIVKFVLFLSVGGALLFFVFKGQEEAFQEQCALDGIAAADCSLWNKLLFDVGSTNKLILLLAVGMYMLSNISRALRWQQLVEPLGYKTKFSNAFWSIMLGYGANLLLPRVGEVARGGAFAKAEDIPMTKVMGTIVLDRVVDMLCLLSVIGLSFLLAYDEIWGFLTIQLEAKSFDFTKLYYLAGFGLVVLVVLWFLREKILASAIGQKILGILKGFGDGIKSILKLKNPALFLLHTIVIWSMYYGMTFVMLKAFPPTIELGAITALVVFVFGSFGIVIPSPGGMGTYHFLVIAALAIYGVSGDDAFSFANISFFTINIFGNIIFGLLAVAMLAILNKNYSPKRISDASV